MVYIVGEGRYHSEIHAKHVPWSRNPTFRPEDLTNQEGDRGHGVVLRRGTLGRVNQVCLPGTLSQF